MARQSRRVARSMPEHELLERALDAWLDWRFHDGQAQHLLRVWDACVAELDRRRRTGRWSGCTCEACFSLMVDRADGNSEERGPAGR